MYSKHSGRRYGDTIFYGNPPAQSEQAPLEVFKQIVQHAARVCTDIAIITLEGSEAELTEIARKNVLRILTWQFLVKDDDAQIEGIIADMKRSSAWRLVLDISQLLGWRVNKPAQFFEWKPGGGLQKEEPLRDAVTRHANKEAPGLGNHSYHQILTVDLHFEDSAVLGSSTHTPAIAVYMVLAAEEAAALKLDRGELQEKRWCSAVEVLEGDFDIYTKTVLLLAIFDILLRAAVGAPV